MTGPAAAVSHLMAKLFRQVLKKTICDLQSGATNRIKEGDTMVHGTRSIYFLDVMQYLIFVYIFLCLLRSRSHRLCPSSRTLLEGIFLPLPRHSHPCSPHRPVSSLSSLLE